jgi:hypothetical protein
MVGDKAKSSERCKETRLRFFLLDLELGTFGRSGGFCGSDGWGHGYGGKERVYISFEEQRMCLLRSSIADMFDQR